jgi:hypothetical protein
MAKFRRYQVSGLKAKFVVPLQLFKQYIGLRIYKVFDRLNIRSLIYYFCQQRPKLRNEELRNLYSSPNIIRQIKSRRMRWAGYMETHGSGDKIVKAFGGKARSKKTTRKTKT